MFHWSEMLRKLFHRPRERAPRTPLRRPRPSVNLGLESLSERILPSASPFAPAAAAEQLPALVAAVERDVSTALQAITNEAAQEVSAVWQRWELVLDTLLHVPGPSTGAATMQTPAPRTAPAGQQEAPATDAGGDALPAPITHSGTQTQGVKPLFGMADVYTWSPTDPSRNASLPQDWKKNGTQQDNTGTTPTAGDQVVFDGGTSNANINWNQSMQVGSMVLGPVGGQAYTGTQTIAAGATVELTGTNFPTSALVVSVPASYLKLDFQNSASKFQIDADATITNMTLTGVDRNAQFVINGGTTTIGQDSYQDLIGVQFVISTNGTLIDQSYCPLTFTNNNLTVSDQGTMQVYYGTGTGSTLIGTNTGISGCYLDVNGGKLIYSGKGDVVDTFAVPVYVHNGGNLALVGAIVQGVVQSNGKLIVKGATVAPGTFGVGMNDAASVVQLSQQSTLECDNNGYIQNDGTLKTVDGPKPCKLQMNPDGSGLVTINGGMVSVADQSTNYGELDVNCGNLNFGAGTLKLGIAGDTTGTNDKLVVNGNLNLNNQGNTTLQVIVGQPPQANHNWTVITASNQLAQFAGGIGYVNPGTVNYNAGPDNQTGKTYVISC